MTGRASPGPTGGFVTAEFGGVPSERPLVTSSSAPPCASPAPTLIHRPASYVRRLELSQVFPVPRPLEVELGTGDGSFLARYAALNPDRNFLGVERLLGRLRKLDRKGLRAGLTNLRLIRLEAGYFLEYLLPLESVQVLHVYFPDPWPKLRHRRHRLVNERFPGLVARVLAPGGCVHLRTDDAGYFARMREVFVANAAFEPVPTPPDLAGLATDFEREFSARGIPTLRAGYRRRS